MKLFIKSGSVGVVGMLSCYLCLQFFFNANIMLSGLIGLNAGGSIGSLVYMLSLPQKQKPQTVRQTCYVMLSGLWAILIVMGGTEVFSLENQMLGRLFVGSVWAAGVSLGVLTNFIK